MPVARIIADHPNDAESVSEYLANRGYTVEVVPPGAMGSMDAELELRVERCAVDAAMARVAAQADDVARFAAPGVFGGALPYVSGQERTSEHGAPAEDPAEPAPAESRDPRMQTAPTPLRFPERTELSERSASGLRRLFGSMAGVLTDAASAAGDALRSGARAANGQIEALNRSLAKRRERQHELHAQRLRRAQQQAAHERARRERQRAEALRQQQGSALPRSVLVTPGMEIAQIVAEAQKAPPEGAEAAHAPGIAHPPPTEGGRVGHPPSRRAGAGEAAPKKRAGYAARGPDRRLSPRRPRRPLPRRWRTAFATAAVSALVLMVGWAMAASGGPPAAAPTDSTMKQAMPFGPVTLLPDGSGTKSAAPRSVTAPAPRSHTQKPAASTAAPARRVSRDAGVADDEVIIHRYEKTRPSGEQSATRREPKRYSDLQ
ncbi:MAG TPA: hypothetical protein VFA60_00375 [Terriglobales bacterium]|nr:hypothetical protein [Terriglobales bacterium]